jgi:hypothetical protein
VSEVESDDVARYYRGYRHVPDAAGIDQPESDEVVPGAEDVPAEAEGIGSERDQILRGHDQE